jgi:FAD/FMN-containing dehydrogenase
MKNVAGYDMRALMCGSRARLGVLTEVSFRVWVRPSCVLDITLSGETGPGGPLHALCSEPALDADWRPDAVSWSASGAEAASLVVRLEGSESSVNARAVRLHRMARENGWTTAETTPGAVADTGAHGDAMAEMQRSLEVRAYRATVARDYLSSAVERLRATFGDRIERLVAFPLGGIVRAEVRVTDVSENGNGALETFARALDAEGHRAAIAVERGSSSDLATADERRDASTRRLESRVVQALGGGPRHWRGDYL